MNKKKGNKMSKNMTRTTLQISILQKDLDLINQVCEEQRRSRSSFLAYAGIKEAKEILEGVNK